MAPAVVHCKGEAVREIIVPPAKGIPKSSSFKSIVEYRLSASRVALKTANLRRAPCGDLWTDTHTVTVFHGAQLRLAGV